ncbi:MAG TPA: ZIP family metal transporter [Gemmatimonadales bacterium]|jgi:ZIP family zinc transporter/zinc and cadmium transporter|nr:ZIP family metal transporter [Gemmatimonadales bacterium]
MTAFLFGLLAALGNMVGALVVVRQARRGLDVVEQFVAFGAGFMVSAVVLAMLPEALNRPGAPVYVLAGFLAVHLAQHVLIPHFHFGEETHRISAAAGVSALVGLSLHTLFDGVAIASGFLVSPELGVLLFLAVFLHKLPEGVTMASVMLAGGQGAGRALGAAGMLGLATIVGVAVTQVLTPLADHGLSLSAGVTLYVAASNLVPEFQARRGWAISLAFFGGAAAMIVARLLLHAAGLPA